MEIPRRKIIWCFCRRRVEYDKIFLCQRHPHTWHSSHSIYPLKSINDVTWGSVEAATTPTRLIFNGIEKLLCKWREGEKPRHELMAMKKKTLSRTSWVLLWRNQANTWVFSRMCFPLFLPSHITETLHVEKAESENNHLETFINLMDHICLHAN